MQSFFAIRSLLLLEASLLEGTVLCESSRRLAPTRMRRMLYVSRSPRRTLSSDCSLTDRYHPQPEPKKAKVDDEEEGGENEE